MKRLSLLASVLLALVALGCNGSNDNDGQFSGNGGIPGLTPGLRIEATAVDDPNQFIDPLNIEVSEQVQFQLVNYTADGTRTVVGGENWLSDDQSNASGRLANNTGLFTASDRPSPEPIGISVTFQGTRYDAFYQVHSRTVRLHGGVFVEGTGTPVYGVVVQFFDDQRLLVGSVRSQADGSIRAIVPSRTTSLQILSETVPEGLFRSFLFANERYDTGRATCRVTFLPYENGIRFLDSDILLAPDTGGSAPDPTGCPVEDPSL